MPLDCQRGMGGCEGYGEDRLCLGAVGDISSAPKNNCHVRGRQVITNLREKASSLQDYWKSLNKAKKKKIKFPF